MSTLYELYNKRTKYRALRENVSNAINVLSNNSAVDDYLTLVDSIISNNYLINDSPCKGKTLSDIKNSLDSDLQKLSASLSSINSMIYVLSREIEEKEMHEIA